MTIRRFFRVVFGLNMSSELACTYAALILNDDGVDITADKIATILKVSTGGAVYKDNPFLGRTRQANFWTTYIDICYSA